MRRDFSRKWIWVKSTELIKQRMHPVARVSDSEMGVESEGNARLLSDIHTHVQISRECWNDHNLCSSFESRGSQSKRASRDTPVRGEWLQSLKFGPAGINGLEGLAIQEEADRTLEMATHPCQAGGARSAIRAPASLLPSATQYLRPTDEFSALKIMAGPFGHFTPFLSAMVDRQARKRIQALEERAFQRDREVAELSATVSRLKATVEAIRASRPLPSPAVPPAPSAPSVAATKPPSAPSSAAAPDPPPPVSPPPQAPPPAPSTVALPAAPAGFASLIVAGFPALFAEFGGKRFALLWRGSRDGFGARDFHGRCDGHAPTLTLIQDTGGNIFGGFTPVEWESFQPGKSKADPSLRSFVFTLKNPHNFPAKKFALKAEGKDRAIFCSSTRAPSFYDVVVCDNCSNTARSYTCNFGRSYVNDTGWERAIFFTGGERFTVKEIEVFEMTD
jgi:hypothetical protein